MDTQVEIKPQNKKIKMHVQQLKHIALQTSTDVCHFQTNPPQSDGKNL